MSADYIVEYTGGILRKWRLSPKYKSDKYYRSFNKALDVMCKKLHINAPTIQINEKSLLGKFDEIRVYYDSERKPTRFGSEEDMYDMDNSIFPEYINHYENGPWLVQVCPHGKTYWNSGKEYNRKTLDRTLLALVKDIIVRRKNNERLLLRMPKGRRL